MSSLFTVRRPRESDVGEMARLHVRAWQETYRGTVLDEVLDDPGFVLQRERMWTALVTEPRYTSVTVAVAEHDGALIGLASAGPVSAGRTQAGQSMPDLQLYTLYVLAEAHGSGAGAALLEAVLDGAAARLWVADPNPRAQAFYRKHGFEFGGAVQVDDGVRELEMVRPARG